MVQDNIADDYLAQYNLNLGVSAVNKIDQFSYIQELTYNGILSFLTANFLGLQDWSDQIQTYSQTNAILKVAYTAIQTLVDNNSITSRNLVNIDGLGEVGSAFESIQGFSKVFTLSDSELQDPNSAEETASNIL